MDSIGTEIIALLKYLLPGLLCAWVFYGLTAFQKPSQFERIIQALIFTLLIQALTSLYQSILTKLGTLISFGYWNEETELVTSVVIAIISGFAFSYFTNNGQFHALCRKLNITKENPYRSEWIHEFLKRETHIILHLKNGRRICGWPNGWPATSDNGHFALSDAAWWISNNDNITEQVLTKTSVILIDVKDVEMIEFLKNDEEQ